MSKFDKETQSRVRGERMTTAGEMPRPTKRRGRPATGKRSDPDFEQVSAYIKKETYRDVKIALSREGRDRKFSELVETLLSKWLQSRS